MKHLIDKTALVAKIENRIKETESMWSMVDPFWEGQISAFDSVLKILDTLEVKGVDLEKELDYKDYMNFFKEHPDFSNGDWGFDECWVFAEYFYKLGIKAQRGE